MDDSAQPVTLNPAQLAEIDAKLSRLRHNINNSLSMIISAAELVKLKPDVAERMAESILAQPEKISEEMREFADFLNEALKLKDPA